MNYLRLIISLALTFALSSLYAQGRDVEVTFHVDMSLETVENGVWIAGGMAGNPGFEMLDEDGDHVYSKTLLVPENAPFTYKFSNGPINADWSGPYEVVPAECGVGEYLDREVMVGNENMEIPPVVFGTCNSVNPPPTEVNVTFHVDMHNETVENGVWLAGGTAGNPGYEMMMVAGSDHLYGVTVMAPANTPYTYKFSNGPINADWSGPYEVVPAECGVGEYLDREVMVGNEDMMIPPVVFGACNSINPPPTEVNVTFHVDMHNETVENGVWLAGGMAGNPGYEMMMVTGSDHLYGVTVMVPANAPFTYKFSNGPINADWSGPYEVVPAECGVGEYLDREVMVGNENMEIPPVVFGTCNSVNPPPTEVNVTFHVDMHNETVENGVWLAGGTAGNPGYEMMMVAGSDHLYGVTVMAPANTPYTYKFSNGPINADWSGPYEVVPAECGVGEYLDREVMVGNEDMMIPPVVFGTCGGDVGPGIVFFEKLDNADVTDPANWDMVTPSVAITRGTNGSLYNPLVEGAANPMISPEGTMWSYGHTGEITGYQEIELGEDLYLPFEEAYIYGAEQGFAGIAGKMLSMHCMEEDKFFDVTFNSWTNGGQGGQGGGGGFSYTRVEVDAPLNPVTEVHVTFHVDMSLETVENGVWLAGGNAGNPGHEMMLMPDSDHLYGVTLLLPANSPFTYKFSNGPINPDWSGPYEEVPAECGVGEYLDREVMVGGEDMMLPPVVFGTCGGVNPPLTDVNVTFYVDMQFEAVENGVWLAGGTAGNPGYEMMQFELAPGFETIYNVTLTLEEGLAFSYKFVNGPIDENWGGAWEEVPAECGVGDFLDREILVQGDPEGNMFLPPVVFGECTVNLEAEVTFHVDMQYEFVDRGVFLAGGDAGNPGFEMFDEDGDHIYSLTLTLPTYDSFTYKFVNGPIDAGWQGGWEEVPAECGVGEFLDRQLLVGNLDEYELPAVVFGSCDEATNVVDVTFHVDMQFETVENGVWLAGGNAGNPGFEMMDEEGDNIYSITLTLPINEPYTYKFANGPINPDWSGPFEEVPAACGVGEYLDREVMVGFQSMNLPPVVFGSCTPEGVVLVTFNVDMQTEAVDPERGVWLAGGNAGNPGHEMMLMDLPGLQRIYTVTIPIESGLSFGYKFANGMINPDWSGDWEEVPEECGFGPYLDRQVIVGEMDMVLPPVGFGSCEPVPFPTASIMHVVDVPEDQGGRVYITFEKSRLDTDEPQRTEMYTIERLDGEQWVGLNSIGAYGSPTYTVEATTLGDSTSESMMMSTYRVVSNMDEGIFVSEPSSGHSVDNIAPMMLVGLDAGHSNGIVNLSWSPSEANDFSHYMIYYGSSPDFIPSPENLLGTSNADPTFEHDVVEMGEYYYVVSAMDIHENEGEHSEVASVVLLSLLDVNGMPEEYTLHQNFPNPFNPTTTLRYDLPEDAMTTIAVYDMMGRLVQTLVSGNKAAGYHSLKWDATNKYGSPVSAGVYIYSIQAGNHRDIKKMILLK